MTGTEKTLGSVPNRLDDDLLNIYRMMPTSDIERLLSHIAWMEEELERIQNLQNDTKRELERVSMLLRRESKLGVLVD